MSTITKILIVEHDPDDLELLHYELKKGGINYVSETVQNELDYGNALKNFIPDIILCDYTFPSFDGPTAFKIREKIAANTPFIFVSGAIGEENSIELIRNGLTDYALKDKLFTLTTKVKRALKESKEKQLKDKTDRELKQSENRLSRAQQVAHMGSWELDFATNIVRWSDEASRIYGLPPDQNSQSFETWLTFIHPEDSEFVRKKVIESRDSLNSSSFHYRILHKDGFIRNIYSECKLEFDAIGKPIGMYGIAKDVTELKLAEEQIEFERNNLSALINNTNDLMWSVDKDFKLITSNQPFDESVKLVSDKAIAKGSNIFSAGFSPKQLNHYKKFYERAFAGEAFTEIEYTDLPVESWSEISFYPIRKGEEVIGTACHSRDISERKRVELKLDHQNKELVKANSELDRFVYSVSHDLRSPLTSVLGLISIIEHESKEPDTLEHAEMIRTRINRLDGFIKKILSYSQNNRTELEVEKIPLQNTVLEIVDCLRSMKDAQDINFEVAINEEQPFYTDRQRFDTVMENLISNAIKYHKKEGAGRYIKVTGKSEKDDLHLRIEDNGIGIAPAHHLKIFDMFFRLSRSIAGSGVGLYIVKEIIEKLHGTIRVNSEEGAGTSFIIKIKNLIT